MKPDQAKPNQRQQQGLPTVLMSNADSEITVTVLKMKQVAPTFVQAHWGQVFQRTRNGLYLPV